MNTPALDRLVEGLSREFQAERSGRVIAELLASYARLNRDWRALALRSSAGYTRNLVVRERAFELLVLCWGPGQESPIHNHENADCWMAILEGPMEELRYAEPAAGTLGPLSPRSQQVFSRGDVAFIRDEMGLHMVRAHDRASSGVSLHLYAPPYDECSVYCPETGTIARKSLVNFSVRGRLLAEAPAQVQAE